MILGKNTDHYATPRAFMRFLQVIYDVDFDPCPYKSTVDGLSLDWIGNIYCNPPYSSIFPWLQKGKDEIAAGRAKLVVYLLPVRTDTKYFHLFILRFAKAVYFLKGRLHFNDAKHPAPFPVMIVLIDKESISNDDSPLFASWCDVEKMHSNQTKLFKDDL